MENHCKISLCVDLERSCSDCGFFDAENATGAGSPVEKAKATAKKKLEDAAPALLAACEDLALPILESSHQLHIGLKKCGQPVSDLVLTAEKRAIKLLKQAIAEAKDKK